MKSQLGGLRRKFMENHLQMGSFQNNGYSNEKEENVIEWLTLF